MNPGTSFFNALLAFVAVIVLIPLALAVLRRTQRFGGAHRGMVQLVGGMSLGPRERIAVVEVGGKWLVLGVTAQSVNVLTTLDSAPVGAMPLPGSQPDNQPGAGGAFARLLAQTRKHAAR